MNTLRAPSVKKLLASFRDLDKEGANLIRECIKNPDSIKENDKFPATNNWLRKCYNRPRDNEVTMSAINEIIGGHGSEAIFERDGDFWPCIEYVNTGDAYTVTIVRTNGNYYISTYGDEVERLGL